MAILKSLINTGVSRLLGKVYMEDLMVSGDTSFSSVSASGNITAGGAFYSGINGLYINNKKAIFTNSATDSWLRINGNINFSSGVYFGNSVVRTDGELQVGSGGAYLKSNSTNTIIANLSSPSGTITNLSSTTGSITTLSSSIINADNVNVRDTLRSKKWEIQVVQTTGDQMIAPMIYFQQGATVVTGNVTTTSVPITITDNNIGTNSTWGGATWYRGSKVKVSGKIGNVVLGVVNATISANMGSTSNKLQLTMEFDNSENVFSSNTTYTSDNLSAMMYQINTTPNAETPTLRPIGIYMTAYGENRNSSISIYGGTNGSSNEDPYKNPNVRVGLLNGLSEDYNIDGTAPSGWGIATTNGWFKGTIHSSSGIIGGWTIGDNNLFSGNLGTGLWLTTANTPTNASIGGSDNINTWRITSGNKFGVTSDGSMYCSSGKIAGWSINADSLSNGTFGSANSIFLIPAGSTTSKQIGGSDSISDWVISVGNSFGVTKAGVLYATGANLSGTLSAGAGSTIGPWTIATTSIWKGNSTMGTSGTGNMYFGNNGLSISNTFMVSNAGVLTATGATIGGTLTAGAGSAIGPWNVTANSIYKGDSESFDTSGVMYFGNQGISLGDKFNVTSSGVLTSKSAQIGGFFTDNNKFVYTGGPDGRVDTWQSDYIYINEDGSFGGFVDTDGDGFYSNLYRTMIIGKKSGGGVDGSISAFVIQNGREYENWKAIFDLRHDGSIRQSEYSITRFYIQNGGIYTPIWGKISSSTLLSGSIELRSTNSVNTSTGEPTDSEIIQITPGQIKFSKTGGYYGQIYANSNGIGVYGSTNLYLGHSTSSSRTDDVVITSSAVTMKIASKISYSNTTCDLSPTQIKFSDTPASGSSTERGRITSTSDGKINLYADSSVNLGYLTSSGTGTSLSVTSTGITASKAFTASSTLSVTGNTTLGGTLSVTGNATFNGNATLNGTSNFQGKLLIYKTPSGSDNGGIQLADGVRINFGGTAALIRNGTYINFSSGHDAVTGTLRHIVLDGDANLRFQAASSKRYKNYVGEESDEDAKKLLTLPVIKFVYKSDYLDKNDHNYGKPLVGLFAEDVAERFDDAGCYDKDSQVENFWDRQLLVRLIKLCQIQQREIDELKDELKNKLK